MLSVSTTLLVLLASCTMFLISPYLPYSFLQATVGNKIGSFALLALVLYVLYIDQTLGLATFLAVAALFLEQRRRTVEHVSKIAVVSPKIQQNFHVEQLNVPAPNIVPGEVHPPRKVADVDDYSFEPSEESGNNKFEQIDESYDDKQPLETVPPQPNEVSEFLQQKGLANIN